MAIKVSPLPFECGDLEPFLSEDALLIHYHNHHRAYADRLNAAIKGTRYSNMNLTDIVLQAEGAIFRNAAQVWNHDFYWRCLTAPSSERPIGPLLAAIETYFESFENFQIEFKRYVNDNFGSGWTWLVGTSGGDLKIINTNAADTPVLDLNTVPLLTLDVWEHAYYVDYRERRANYVDNFWECVNWKFVKSNFELVF